MRAKSLKHLDRYEFESEEVSNDEKLDRKEKKLKEDEKFNMFVKYHDLLQYGRGKSQDDLSTNKGCDSKSPCKDKPNYDQILRKNTFGGSSKELLKEQQNKRSKIRFI